MQPTPSPPDRFRLSARLLCLLFLLSPLYAAAARSGPDRGEPRTEPLNVELSAVFADDGSPGVAATAAVPYRSLVFIRAGEGWASELRLTVSARRDGRTVAGGVASARAVASDYAATRGGARLRPTVRLDLPDDAPVELLVRAEVVGTSRWWERELAFSPGAGRGIPWAFAGFAWNLPDDQEEGLRLDAGIDSLRVDVSLVRRPAVEDPRAADLVLVLLDGRGAELELWRRALDDAAPGTRRTLTASLASLNFPFGLQTLDVRLVDDRGASLPLTPDHSFVNLGVPFADDEAWRRHTTWLDGRGADGETRERLRRLPPAERAAAWRAFWDGRPAAAPLTETEHLLRIVEADRRFGRFGRGALSDRGRCLIRYGPPASVDHHVMDRQLPGDWEIWTYPREGFRVIFHDPYGLGDFREYDRIPY